MRIGAEVFGAGTLRAPPPYASDMHRMSPFYRTANMSTPPSQLLIVDDNLDAADTMREVLLCSGFDSVAVYNVADALQQIATATPLCVILDVNMPGQDGLDLARQVRADHGDSILLVAVSGAARGDSRAEQTRRIVDHYFTKPVDVCEIEQVVRSCAQ